MTDASVTNSPIATSPGCLILAAGSHRRFGSAKLLHPLADGRPLIAHTLDVLRASGLPLALVHRPDDHALLAQIDSTDGIQLIPNPNHALGLGHSIACGVRATAHWQGWIICLADMPQIRTDTILAIADALRQYPIVIPHFRNQPGHPRGFQRRFFDDLCNLQGDKGARDLIVQHSTEIGVLNRPDAGILLDIDYPEDLYNLEHSATGYPDSNALLTGAPYDMTEPQNKQQDGTDPTPSTPTQPEPSTQITPSTDASPNEPVDIATPQPFVEIPTPETVASAEPTAVAVSESAHAEAQVVSAVAPVEAPTERLPEVQSEAETPAEIVAEGENSAEAAVVAGEVAGEVANAESADTDTGTATDTDTAATDAESAAPVVVAPIVQHIPQVRFRELPLDARIQQAVVDLGFEFCTPIQALSLPLSLQGKDVIGKAQTGTGKTAAFLITVINHLLKTPEQEERYNGEPRAFILAPTRELAIQIEKDAKALIKHTPLTLMSIVGGMDYQKQQRRLQNEIIDIVVGTPGRLIDFVRNKDLFLSETEIVVIDEADRMLDMGFIPDVKRLVRETPFKEYRQTLMFSATFTQDIMNLSGSWTRNAEHLEVASDSAAADTVDQKVYIVTTEEKFNLLYNLINLKNLERVMIFANRRDETRDLTHKLRDYGIKCAMLSGEVPQEKRIKVLEGFREGRIRVLVATDVAGRGIHIDDITFVVNYTLPEDPEDYVHRIGRTGRAGKSGTSISFACEEDAFQLPAIEKLLGAKLDCSQPETELLADVPPPVLTPEQQKERDSHTHRRRR
ncbi:MAG TPA: ATP-dependent RNA helicase RhlB, partial [Dongiaceae bacterium]|nr:ATP-dependent RNA helicase RhlB [Dongiaceae bacterium]